MKYEKDKWYAEVRRGLWRPIPHDVWVDEGVYTYVNGKHVFTPIMGDEFGLDIIA